MSCEDQHFSGRPNEVTMPIMVKKICKSPSTDMIDISKSAVHCILTENLDMRKLCARWVPNLFPMKQKQCLENVANEYSVLFHSKKTGVDDLSILLSPII